MWTDVVKGIFDKGIGRWTCQPLELTHEQPGEG